MGMVQDQKPQGEDRPGVRNGHMVSSVLLLYRCGHWKLTPGNTGNTGDTHRDISAGSGIREPDSNNGIIANTCTHATADSYTHAYPGTTVDAYTYARPNCTDASVPTNAHATPYAHTSAYATTTPYTNTSTDATSSTYADATAYANILPWNQLQ